MNTIYKELLLVASLFIGTLSLSAQFVTSRDGKFWREGKPYYYVGTNLWYGAILGSEGQGGNRARLCRERLPEAKRHRQPSYPRGLRRRAGCED